MVRAAGPDRRTMPIPPRPGGVEMATMVSSKSVTDFLMVMGEKILAGGGAFLLGVLRKVVCRTWFFDGEIVVD
jgi:hypothetical protein